MRESVRENVCVCVCERERERGRERQRERGEDLKLGVWSVFPRKTGMNDDSGTCESQRERETACVREKACV